MSVNVDVYTNAPLVGFLYGRRAEVDDTKNPETNQVYNQNVMGDRVIYSQEELMFNFRLIMLLDKEYEPDEADESTKPLDTWVKTLPMRNALTAMCEVELMSFYEKLIEETSTPEDYANNLYDFLEEFQEKFNEDVSSEDILKLCSK